MAFLPSQPLILTGGCHCGASKYTITIPALPDRPIIPNTAPTAISPTENVPSRLPAVVLDHCQNCRRVAGVIVACWLIIPPGWLTWTLVTPLSSGEGEKGEGEVRRDVPAVDVCGPNADTNHYVRQYRATDRAIRTFCSRCGTNLTYYGLARHGTPAAFMDVAVGSLDAESFKLVRPERHVWWESGAGWVKELVRWGTGAWLVRQPTGNPATAIDGDGEEREGLWGRLEEDIEGKEGSHY
jgi:hypothetical protein